MKHTFFFTLCVVLFSCATKKEPKVDNALMLKRVWMLVAFDTYTKAELVEKKAFLDLTQPERAAAKMGCNQMSFEYTIKNNTEINFQQGLATRMFCQDMKLENAFSKTLPTITNYELKGHQLTLTNKEGAKMVFIAQDWD